MPPKNTAGVGVVKDFQPWFFIIGGIFSLGVIWGVLNSRIEKNEDFQDTQKHTNEILDNNSIERHEKSILHTNQKFKELRDDLRLHRDKTNSTHEKVIELSVSQNMTQKNVTDVKEDVKENKIILEKMYNEIIKQNRNKEK